MTAESKDTRYTHNSITRLVDCFNVFLRDKIELVDLFTYATILVEDIDPSGWSAGAESELAIFGNIARRGRFWSLDSSLDNVSRGPPTDIHCVEMGEPIVLIHAPGEQPGRLAHGGRVYPILGCIAGHELMQAVSRDR